MWRFWHPPGSGNTQTPGCGHTAPETKWRTGYSIPARAETLGGRPGALVSISQPNVVEQPWIEVGLPDDRVRADVVGLERNFFRVGRGDEHHSERGGGDGLIGMRDRVGAVRGELEIISSPGRGTTVRGTIPEPVTEPAGAQRAGSG